MSAALTKRRINSLIRLGNQYKNTGDYEIANIVFAILLQDKLDCRNDDLLVFVENNGTEDHYYDIVALQPKTSANSICIPLPMLSEEMKIFCCKVGGIIDKIEHNRKITPDAEKQKAIIKSFFRSMRGLSITRALRLLSVETRIDLLEFLINATRGRNL